MGAEPALSRPVVMAWCDFQPRTAELARELSGDALFIAPAAKSALERLPPVRYLRAAQSTLRELSARNPSAIIVVAPPVFAPLVAWAWSRRKRCPLIIDFHTAAFHSRRWGWALPLTRFLALRSQAVSLHTAAMRDEAGHWGAKAFLLPDDLPDAALAEAVPRRGDRRRVVVAGALDDQEPVAETLLAAEALPDVEFLVTGAPTRLPSGMAERAPANVTFTGWLQYPRFLGELAAADLVVAFSLDSGIMNRVAFEAIALGRPLVLTDWPGLRERFGDSALYCAPKARAMAETIRSALLVAPGMAVRAVAARTRLCRQREIGLDILRRQLAIGLTRPKRVLLISQHPLPDNPTLRRNVEHLLRTGTALDILVMKGARAWKAPDGSRLRSWTGHLRHRRDSRLRYLFEYWSFFLWALAMVVRLSVRVRYVTVQVDNLPDFLVFAATPARLRGARLVLFMFELMPEMTMARLAVGWNHPMVRLSRLQERLAVAWADGVVVVNEPCREALVGRGLDGARIRVVPNTQPVASLPAAAGPPSGAPPLIVTHATLIKRYGVQVAVEAISRLQERWPAIRLEVLGEGEYLPSLRALAADLGLDGAIHFTGFLPWDEVMRRISGAHVGIVPVLPDGYGHLLLPMKLLDYAAMGVPAVVSRLPTIERYFSDEAVSYFEPGDPDSLAAAVAALLEDPIRAGHQARQATGALRRLSWDEGVSASYDNALFE